MSVNSTAKNSSTTIPSNPPQASKKKKSYRPALLIALLLIVGYLGLASYYKNSAYQNSGGKSYQEKVMTVEEMERAEPLHFLSADGEYNKTFGVISLRYVEK